MTTTIIRKPKKLTTSARITLTAFSLIGFVGGWNLIARYENQEAQAQDSVSLPPSPTPLPSPSPSPSPTPWPTIPPLAELPPIPTLAPTLTSSNADGDSILEPRDQAPLAAPAALVPLPTLAPLPDLPAPPPPPPPAPAPVQNHQSGGS